MPQKRYRPEEIIAKLRQADVLLGEGRKVPEAVKALGITEVTYYRWRKEYGGLPWPRYGVSRTSSARTPACARRSPTSPSTSSSSRRPPGETSEPLTAPQVRASSL
jgi:hypothetical protein